MKGERDLVQFPSDADALGAWVRHMQAGEFGAAWRISDLFVTITNPPGLPRNFQRFWNGEPLLGKKVLVRCYHGLGDTIQFIRYAPALKKMVAEVIVWAQPSLLPLLKTITAIDRLLPLHDGKPDIAYDTDIEVMELPHIFRTTLSSIPYHVPYLHLEPRSLPKNKLAVGLCWSAGDWDGRRSLRLKEFDPLMQLGDIDWYIFQRGPALLERPPQFGHLPEVENLFEEARVLASMDLLITVDTMLAHLAGALNVPVWTLLQHHADWRWMRDRDDSPWYPSMRLFRQERQGEWEPVVARIASELRKSLHCSRR